MERILVMDIGTLEQDQTEEELRENGYRLQNILVTTGPKAKDFKDVMIVVIITGGLTLPNILRVNLSNAMTTLVYL